jgi:hypothetical protein
MKKKCYLVGMIMKSAGTNAIMTVSLFDKSIGVIGMVPVFSSKRKAQTFAKGSKFPIITMEMGE